MNKMCKRQHQLLLVNNNDILVYHLDEKKEWTIGRESRSAAPDIALQSSTISRSHGKFSVEDGIWFYSDNSKNGTIYKGNLLTKGLGGRTKPVMLENGDTLVFEPEAVWAFYVNTSIDSSNWKMTDLQSDKEYWFNCNGEKSVIENSLAGKVYTGEEGILVTAGDRVYSTEGIQIYTEQKA